MHEIDEDSLIYMSIPAGEKYPRRTYVFKLSELGKLKLHKIEMPFNYMPLSKDITLLEIFSDPSKKSLTVIPH